jgi:hypothetical protein
MVVWLANLSKPIELLVQSPVHTGKVGTVHPSFGVLPQPRIVGDRGVIVLGQEM